MFTENSAAEVPGCHVLMSKATINTSKSYFSKSKRLGEFYVGVLNLLRSKLDVTHAPQFQILW